MIGPMLQEAARAMAVNRLRTFLTMLGMVIGVGSVILILAIGQGAQFLVDRAISSMGSNLLVVLSGSSTSGGMRMGMGVSPTLTMGDAEAIAELPWITGAAPANPTVAQVAFAANNWNTTIVGTTPDYFSLRQWPLTDGTAFTDTEVRTANRVAIIGQTAAEKLFGEENPIGQTIRIKQSPFQVIGLLTRKGQSLDGRDQDDAIFIPVTTAQTQLFGVTIQGSVRFILAQAISAKALDAAEIAIEALLHQRHRIQEGEEEDFNVHNLTAVTDIAATATRILSLLLSAIASISLLVGGIGIMNIMLVSVTERTREIGIRMALGARQRDIRIQFLLEAVILSVAGCLLGVGWGIGAAWLVSRLLHFTVVITVFSIVLAFVVAAAVGIFFGFYPANKAAGLNPIEALRHP